ncbi:hypothetical protein LAJ19_15330 (plasmid) [Deinococcus taeanensis]|uniref:hypothetical protein n=1 Tax=Deinococcus taeanensis TaxID=2737050 RepID=UPI001CDB71BE|nr:hypothetical protein [Deinococcus taeanensis]UBV44174.1 hypothetical protein LAJ19_15330 [Deinococcus taeanensis]
MNTTLNLSTAGLSLGVLAAGLIFAYGVWLGRRETGWRAAQGVLAAVVLGSLLPLPFLLGVPFMPGGQFTTVSGAFMLAAANIVQVGLMFLPWLVAGNWLEILRREGSRA